MCKLSLEVVERDSSKIILSLEASEREGRAESVRDLCQGDDVSQRYCGRVAT